MAVLPRPAPQLVGLGTELAPVAGTCDMEALLRSEAVS